MSKRGLKFWINNSLVGKVSQAYALGFHYHTLDLVGNCVKGESYMLNKDLASYKLIDKESDDE